MSRQMSNARRKKIRQQSQEVRRAIDAMDYVSSGTLHTRTKVCGRKECRCATDPQARHGPYFEWSRRIGGRLVHSVLSEDQAELVSEAISNYREIQRLLTVWEARTAQVVLDPDDDELD